MRQLFNLTFLLGLALGATGALAAETSMSEGAQVSAPKGFVAFCLRDPAQCDNRRFATSAKTRLTPANWDALSTVNDYVNTAVPQIDDAANYGTSELWAYPNAQGGDCEDLALLKRRMLVTRGFPLANLLLAVVRERNGNGHAVLLVETDRGTLVLDNKTGAIRLWSETTYTWIKRQSRESATRWVSLDAHPYSGQSTTASVTKYAH